MEVRAGRLRDTESVREIWRHCFGDDAFCDWFFTRLYNPKYLRVLTVDQTVVSMAFCFPREIKSQNRVCKAWYLYGIGTHPSFRGKGYAKRLIEECISEAKEEGLDLCFLIPAEQSLFSYYERIGFSVVWKNTTLTQEAIAEQIELETRSVSSCNIELLGWIYQTAFPTRVCRAESDWNLILEEFRLSQGDAKLLYANGQLLGYAFLYEKENVLHIRELALCKEVDRVGVCHALCKGMKWELTQIGNDTAFAMGYPLSENGEIKENLYCNLLYN